MKPNDDGTQTVVLRRALGWLQVRGKECNVRSNLNNSRREHQTDVMICKHCGAELIVVPESDEGDWVINCFDCGAKNLIEAGLKIVGWRI